jgi:DNA-binding HxlR family transcriptional regulator
MPSLSETIQSGGLKGNLLVTQCPSRQILKDVTSRWGVLVLIALQTGTLRFAELRRTVGGVSDRMLSQTLQTLERDGFVSRTVYDVVPPHVEYSLTARGCDVAELVRALADWIENATPDIMAGKAPPPTESSSGITSD